jgi:hypothetical protein
VSLKVICAEMKLDRDALAKSCASPRASQKMPELAKVA